MKIIFNGAVQEASATHLSIDNRAFTYGDGLFETILASDKEIFFLEDHLQRISEGMDVLRIHLPAAFSLHALRSQMLPLISENKIKGLARIKLMVWRKTGGLFSPESQEAEYLITAVAAQPDHTPRTKVAFFDEVPVSYSTISRFKTISALPYIMAGIFKMQKGLDDVILLNTGRHIAETLACNIFWIRGGMVYTPSLDTGCIDGVMRKQILRYLGEKHIPVTEGKFGREDLLAANFVFTSNALGVTPILKTEDTSFSESSELFEALKVHFQRQP